MYARARVCVCVCVLEWKIISARLTDLHAQSNQFRIMENLSLFSFFFLKDKMPASCIEIDILTNLTLGVTHTGDVGGGDGGVGGGRTLIVAPSRVK